jgi:membrane-bound serine protease (ClpP class)
VAALMLAAVASEAGAARRAVVLDVEGAIGPALADYIEAEVKAVSPADTGLIILRMNTPGGLDSSMRKIVSIILASPVPVATYVAPSGARAASAGTYIAYGSAIAAMAPGTNLGAATPVQIGSSSFFPTEKKKDEKKEGENAAPTETSARKAINDATAYIRSLAELNKRNIEWAEKAVRSAESLSASAALEMKVIDIVASDIPDLLRQADGRMAVVNGKSVKLETAGLEVVRIEPGWRTELLALITNPNVAFLLMMIGIYGLIFELATPGSIGPGLIGGICLLVALYALNLLPINYAGAGLVLLGIALMIAEVFIGSFGIIGVAGVVAFGIGSFMMFRSGVPGFEISIAVVAASTIVSAGLFLLALAMLVKSRQQKVVTGAQALLGAIGETVAWQQQEGRVRVEGEIWFARSSHPLAPGTRIKVVSREGLVLFVEPA